MSATQAKMNSEQALLNGNAGLDPSGYHLVSLESVPPDAVANPAQLFPPAPFNGCLSADMSHAPNPYMAHAAPLWHPTTNNALLKPEMDVDARLRPVPAMPDDTSGSSFAPTDATRTSSRATSNTSIAKSSRTSSKPSITPAGPEPAQGSRKSRKISHQQSSVDDDEMPLDAQDPKRDKFLERNRVAASKCRQKKKQWVKGLEEAQSGLEQQHENLQNERRQLVNQVSDMKTELMRHANCNDPIISAWIENEAKRYVLRATEQNSRKMDSISGTSGYHSRHGSFAQTSPTASIGTIGTRLTSSEPFDPSINYDHMPDEMFDDDEIKAAP